MNTALVHLNLENNLILFHVILKLHETYFKVKQILLFIKLKCLSRFPLIVLFQQTRIVTLLIIAQVVYILIKRYILKIPLLIFKIFKVRWTDGVDLNTILFICFFPANP